MIAARSVLFANWKDKKELSSPDFILVGGMCYKSKSRSKTAAIPSTPPMLKKEKISKITRFKQLHHL